MHTCVWWVEEIVGIGLASNGVLSTFGNWLAFSFIVLIGGELIVESIVDEEPVHRGARSIFSSVCSAGITLVWTLEQLIMMTKQANITNPFSGLDICTDEIIRFPSACLIKPKRCWLVMPNLYLPQIFNRSNRWQSNLILRQWALHFNVSERPG